MNNNIARSPNADQSQRDRATATIATFREDAMSLQRHDNAYPAVALTESANRSRDLREVATLARGAMSVLASVADGLGRSAARQDSAQDARWAIDARQLASDAHRLANELEAAS